jgi:hypothetical protein
MSGQTAVGLPHVDRLSPRQQMAISCARCARRLGMSGRVWGEARYRGRLFRLWICTPDCAPPALGDSAA